MNDYNIVLNYPHLALSPKFEEETRSRLKNKKCLEYYGFKVYSQNDEDGIIEEIFNRVGTTNKIFIEFGVQNGLECNTHYLLFKGWRGLWIDGNEDYFKDLHEKFAPVIENGQLKVLQAFITRENINDLFTSMNFTGEIDLLGIDIDGNDWYVWQAINVVKPRVVVIEYNAKFPPNCDWKQAYNRHHVWDLSDWQGASLKALELLGRELGYQLVGTNFNGVNAFFVRKDLARDLFIEPATAENLYNRYRYNYVNYVNAHPAKYCLAVQKENYGLLNYKPNCDAVPLMNFYNEAHEGKHSFRVMRGKKSSVLVRNMPMVVLPYFLMMQDANQLDGLTLTVYVEDNELYQMPVRERGLIVVNLPPSDVPLAVTLELSKDFPDRAGKRYGLAIIFETD